MDREIKKERNHGHSLINDKTAIGNEGTNEDDHSEPGIRSN